jgi:hypothetical protein
MRRLMVMYVLLAAGAVLAVLDKLHLRKFITRS